VQYTYEKSGFTLDCACLSVEAGESILINGAIGSGKSTLGKLMTGILKPGRGDLLLNGAVANEYPLGYIGQTVGYLFQEPGRQLFCSTVGEELLFKASFLGQDLTSAKERAGMLLQRFGLTHLQERGVFHLSRGEKQRLALAAVMMQQPQLLILDEPTSGLDQEMRDTLYDLLDDLLEGGVSVALISHDSIMVRRFGHRVITTECGVVKC